MPMTSNRPYVASPFTVAVLAAAFLSGPAAPADAEAPPIPPPSRGFEVHLLVEGRPLPQHVFGGVRYVEATKGREYAIRLRNPLPVRVAVALSVDGLNTIDARHTDARSARKWVLDPYETVTIRGWQTSMSDARRFFFTTEERSYATWLGRPANQGVISAVFFRERVARVVPLAVAPWQDAAGAPEREASAGAQRSDPRAKRPQAAPPSESAKGQDVSIRTKDEYAATGIGRTVDNAVRQIHLDLEEYPAASVDIRYEYRPQLVKLGVLPPVPATDEPLDRRGNARGFTPGFCPVPRQR
jgi:hypothetical protein